MGKRVGIDGIVQVGLGAWVALALGGGPAVAAEAGPRGQLEVACGWLERAVAADPGRDDAFGMFMRSMRPKCQGMLEGLGRGDGSVAEDTVVAVARELDELRAALGEPEGGGSGPPVEEGRTPADAEAAKVAPPVVGGQGADHKGGTDTSGSAQRDTVPAEAGRGGVSGTWFQAPRKVLDREVKRTLNLFQRGRVVEGELYEEVSHPAPSAWVEGSCGGNTTFRMVTTARVTGEVKGTEVDLRRDVPRVLACTCASRCLVEQRRRGLELAVSPSGMQLTDDLGVFVREGAPQVVAASAGALSFTGEWETAPFLQRGERVVLHLGLSEGEGGKVRGVLTVLTDQPLPLKSWSERFCAGADRFARVEAFDVEGARRGGSVTLATKAGRVVTCTCPSKCFAPKRRGLTLALTPDGRSLDSDDGLFERR